MGIGQRESIIVPYAIGIHWQFIVTYVIQYSPSKTTTKVNLKKPSSIHPRYSKLS